MNEALLHNRGKNGRWLVWPPLSERLERSPEVMFSMLFLPYYVLSCNEHAYLAELAFRYVNILITDIDFTVFFN